MIIERGWSLFRNTVLNKNAPRAQVLEMEMAFYAGHAHLLSLIGELSCMVDAPPALEELLSLLAQDVVAYNEDQLANAERGLAVERGHRTDN